MKVFRSEYAAGYSPHDYKTSLYDIKRKVDTVFTESNLNAVEENRLQDLHVDRMLLDNSEDEKGSCKLPLSLTLLRLAFEDNGFTTINKKAIAALCSLFSQKQKLLAETSKYCFIYP